MFYNVVYVCFNTSLAVCSYVYIDYVTALIFFFLRFSSLGCIGDTQFHFRIRQCYGRKPLIRSHVSYNKNCPITLQV